VSVVGNNSPLNALLKELSPLLRASSILFPASVSLRAVSWLRDFSLTFPPLVPPRSTLSIQDDFSLALFSAACQRDHNLTWGWMIIPGPATVQRTPDTPPRTWWFSKAVRLIAFILSAGHTHYKIMQLLFETSHSTWESLKAFTFERLKSRFGKCIWLIMIWPGIFIPLGLGSPCRKWEWSSAQCVQTPEGCGTGDMLSVM
jgi:hypothetical protein